MSRSLAVFVVVVAALLEHVRNLLIGVALAGADLPDALQQFVEVVPTKGAAVLHQLVVEDKTLLDVLAQRPGGPLAEARRFFGVDTAAYSDDRVEMIEVCRLCRKF